MKKILVGFIVTFSLALSAVTLNTAAPIEENQSVSLPQEKTMQMMVDPGTLG